MLDHNTFHQDITPKLRNSIIHWQNICIGRLYAIIGTAYLRTFRYRPFLTSSFVTFFPHCNSTSLFLFASLKAAQAFPKNFTKISQKVPKNRINPQKSPKNFFLGTSLCPSNPVFMRHFTISMVFPKMKIPNFTMSRGKPLHPLWGKLFYPLYGWSALPLSNNSQHHVLNYL